jgi:phospholipase C
VVSRRRFLKGAAAVGATLGFPNVRIGRAADTPLRHVVLLMRENRSFDHYFGRYPGADGLPAGAPVTAATADCITDPPHDEDAIQSDAAAGAFTSPASRLVFAERDIPLAWALARRFTLCDRYFASVLGPTFANRLFSVAASAGAYTDNPAAIDPAQLPRPNLVDRLEAAGLDWACYLANRPDERYNAVAYYPERENDPRANRSYSEFLADAASARLPHVAWVVPEDPLTEHPASPPQWGQRFAALTVRALMSGPLWASTALILNYDESGGFYDHVAPPAVAGNRLGYRVPCTVVSPYSRPGHVSTVLYDHASALALVERTFGVAPLGSRDAAASPLEDCFDFDHPAWEPVVFPASPEATGCAAPPPWAARLLAMPLGRAAASGGPAAGELALGLGGLAAGLLGGAAIGLRNRRREGGEGRS